MALSDKQQLFCDEYLISLNATQAAKKAGYSEKTAKSQGQRLLTNADVSAYIKERQQIRHESLIADREELLKYLTRVVRREEKEMVVSSETTETTDFVKGHQQKKKKTKPVTVEIDSKLSDSNKAAELLCKHLGLLVDKIDIGQQEGKPFEINISVVK